MSQGRRNRRAGHQWERDVAAWLRGRGVAAVTSRELNDGYQSGADLVTDLPVTVECKNVQRWDLAGWVAQAVADAGDAPASVWVKRPRCGDPGECYVVMRATDFLRVAGPMDDTEVPF